ncbi:hypothetical protein LEP1GSC038_3084 [Leptospira weilii str. 2006001855]|uniref:Uncharacterized protein n=1 Tax=Leptospira weilii str. 2006001855 TaxID=996804 RepID=M6FWK8_9LEPT|nr:hypothetical protein LEP1GSC038_3084 [Leptospira weilii str. 2006001855]
MENESLREDTQTETAGQPGFLTYTTIRIFPKKISKVCPQNNSVDIIRKASFQI